MKLAKIPEDFGLQELCKGYFLHLFNTKVNQKYVGPFPALKAYGYEFMSSGERKTLVEWHAMIEGKTVNFRDGLSQQCHCGVVWILEI